MHNVRTDCVSRIEHLKYFKLKNLNAVVKENVCEEAKFALVLAFLRSGCARSAEWNQVCGLRFPL